MKKMVINRLGGAKIVFDFRKIIKEWNYFYRRINLSDHSGQLAQIPVDACLPEKYWQQAKVMIKKHCFDACVILPANLSCCALLNNLKIIKMVGQLRADIHLTPISNFTAKPEIVFVHANMKKVNAATRHLKNKTNISFNAELEKLNPEYWQQGRRMLDWLIQAFFLHWNRIKNIRSLQGLPLTGEMTDKSVKIIGWNKSQTDHGIYIEQWRHDREFFPEILTRGVQFCFRQTLESKISPLPAEPPIISGHPVFDFLNQRDAQVGVFTGIE